MTTGGHYWVCSLCQQCCSQQGVYLQRMYAEIGTVTSSFSCSSELVSGFFCNTKVRHLYSDHWLRN